MNRRVLAGLVTALFITFLCGCSTILKHLYDPSHNETAWNTVRASYYWTTLNAHGYPGISTNQHGDMQCFSGLTASNHARYPWEAKVRVTLDDVPGIYYWFSIEIPSPESDLVMKRAWKADKSGKILEDFLPLPSDEDQKKANDELRNSEELKKLRAGKK